MTGTYNPWLVCLSVFVAIFVSYTALNLATRVSSANNTSARLWHAGGAVAMGGGIWSMHFIGMLAFSLPIPLSYDVGDHPRLARHRDRHLRLRALDRGSRRADARRARDERASSWGSASAPCTTPA